MKALLFATAVFALVGCGSVHPSEFAGASPAAPRILGGHRIESSNGSVQSFPPGAGREPPLSVSVAQAFYADDRLNIKVRVLAKTELPSDELVVSIVGLREGHTIEKKHQRIGKLLEHATIRGGESVLVPFELEGRELSEYQVQTRWGSDAVDFAEEDTVPDKVETAAPVPPDARALAPNAPTHPDESAAPPVDLNPDEIPIVTPSAQAKPAPPEGRLELRNVQLVSDDRGCTKPPCDLHYVIHARAVNEAAVPIGKLQLAVGFAWSESESLPKPPERGLPKQPREELVDLGTLVLSAGEGKKLKIRINRGVPEVPGGAFLPYIRIVRAEPAGA